MQYTCDPRLHTPVEGKRTNKPQCHHQGQERLCRTGLQCLFFKNGDKFPSLNLYVSSSLMDRTEELAWNFTESKLEVLWKSQLKYENDNVLRESKTFMLLHEMIQSCSETLEQDQNPIWGAQGWVCISNSPKLLHQCGQLKQTTNVQLSHGYLSSETWWQRADHSWH